MGRGFARSTLTRRIPNAGRGDQRARHEAIGELAPTLFADRQARRGLMPPWANGKNGKEYRATMGNKPIGGIFSVGVEEAYRWKDSVQTRPRSASGSRMGWPTAFGPGSRSSRRAPRPALAPCRRGFLPLAPRKREVSAERNAARPGRHGLLAADRLYYGGARREARWRTTRWAFTRRLSRPASPSRWCTIGCSSGHVGAYRTLILPNIAALSDGQCRQLREFVQRGGSMVATHETSLYDERGRRATTSASPIFSVSRSGGKRGADAELLPRLEDDPRRRGIRSSRPRGRAADHPRHARLDVTPAARVPRTRR